jgi:CDP-glucose 4,6-dehydratase
MGLATARAGNIVGGGDFATDRIVPDFVRSRRSEEPLTLRHPEAVRPWQHVLDAVGGYLRLGDGLVRDRSGCDGAWNFGPPPEAAATVGEVAALLASRWQIRSGRSVPPPILAGTSGPTERAVLTLDSAKAASRLSWWQILGLQETLDWTVDWYHDALTRAGEVPTLTRAQIAAYLARDDGARTASRVDDEVAR